MRMGTRSDLVFGGGGGGSVFTGGGGRDDGTCIPRVGVGREGDKLAGADSTSKAPSSWQVVPRRYWRWQTGQTLRLSESSMSVPSNGTSGWEPGSAPASSAWPAADARLDPTCVFSSFETSSSSTSLLQGSKIVRAGALMFSSTRNSPSRRRRARRTASNPFRLAKRGETIVTAAV